MSRERTLDMAPSQPDDTSISGNLTTPLCRNRGFQGHRACVATEGALPNFLLPGEKKTPSRYYTTQARGSVLRVLTDGLFPKLTPHYTVSGLHLDRAVAMDITIDQALLKAVAAHRAGDVSTAEKLYSAILHAQPSHPDANHNLGILTLGRGKPAKAVPLFKAAISGNSGHEQFWISYVNALIEAGQFDQAHHVLEDRQESALSPPKRELLRQKLSARDPAAGVTENKTTPASKKISTASSRKRSRTTAKKGGSRDRPPERLVDEALSAYNAGRLDLAQALVTKLLKTHPQSALCWKILGAVLQRTGKTSESIEAKQKAVKFAPQDAEAHSNLGNSLHDLGQFHQAEMSCRTAIQLDPKLAVAHYNLANTLLQTSKLEEAARHYRIAINLKQDYASAYNNLGRALKALGKVRDAETAFRKAISLNPKNADAHNNLGTTLSDQGKFRQAENSYRRALAEDPKLTEAYRNLSSVKTFTSKDGDYEQMRSLQNDQNLSEGGRASINFALAKASEDLGDYEEAYDLYKKGNALRKKLIAYDITIDVKRFEQVKAHFRDIREKSLTGDQLKSATTPIFIIGMPRSGTTVVEQIISSHSLVTGAGELTLLGNLGTNLAMGSFSADGQALLKIRTEYLTALAGLSGGKPFVTDKMPQNFLLVPVIAASFPDAKIVHVSRDPAAVCWANYKQYFSAPSLNYSYSLSDIVQYYEMYVDLMRLWVEHYGSQILELSYDRLTQHQEEETRRLISYLDLVWEGGCLEPQKNGRIISTASNVQIRQGVFKGSSEKWKRFAPYLHGILDSLETPN